MKARTTGPGVPRRPGRVSGAVHPGRASSSTMCIAAPRRRRRRRRCRHRWRPGRSPRPRGRPRPVPRAGRSGRCRPRCREVLRRCRRCRRGRRRRVRRGPAALPRAAGPASRPAGAPRPSHRSAPRPRAAPEATSPGPGGRRHRRSPGCPPRRGVRRRPGSRRRRAGRRRLPIRRRCSRVPPGGDGPVHTAWSAVGHRGTGHRSAVGRAGRACPAAFRGGFALQRSTPVRECATPELCRGTGGGPPAGALGAPGAAAPATSRPGPHGPHAAARPRCRARLPSVARWSGCDRFSSSRWCGCVGRPSVVRWSGCVGRPSVSR